MQPLPDDLLHLQVARLLVRVDDHVIDNLSGGDRGEGNGGGGGGGGERGGEKRKKC